MLKAIKNNSRRHLKSDVFSGEKSYKMDVVMKIGMVFSKEVAALSCPVLLSLNHLYIFYTKSTVASRRQIRNAMREEEALRIWNLDDLLCRPVMRPSGESESLENISPKCAKPAGSAKSRFPQQNLGLWSSLGDAPCRQGSSIQCKSQKRSERNRYLSFGCHDCHR